MNEPLPQPSSEPPGYEPPNFWLMFFLGFLLLLFSGLLCGAFNSPIPAGLGLIGAIVSIFFRGWRGIFAGYFGTIGLIALAVIIICGTGLVPPFRE
jgi:MFS family permease